MLSISLVAAYRSPVDSLAAPVDSSKTFCIGGGCPEEDEVDCDGTESCGDDEEVNCNTRYNCDSGNCMLVGPANHKRWECQVEVPTVDGEEGEEVLPTPVDKHNQSFLDSDSDFCLDTGS